jgi:hypothetical protein
MERFVAAVGNRDGAADLGESLADKLGDLLFIFGDEDMHGERWAGLNQLGVWRLIAISSMGRG